jgi:hypothetical protein
MARCAKTVAPSLLIDLNGFGSPIGLRVKKHAIAVSCCSAKQQNPTTSKCPVDNVVIRSQTPGK